MSAKRAHLRRDPVLAEAVKRCRESAIRRVPFVVLPLAHDHFRCTRCNARMPRGDKAVALHEPGVAVEFQHDGKCPPFDRQAS